MIPGHLIDKAAQAIVVGMGSKLLLADMHPEDAGYARADARAALEAVAADIWDEAIDAASEQGIIQIPDNPYRASETA